MANDRNDGADSRVASLADLLDGVRWDYDPSRHDLDTSPLVTAERYFAEFPWEPDATASEDDGPAHSIG